MLFPLFIEASLSKTSLNIRKIISGVWFVNQSSPLTEEKNIRFFHANISEIPKSNSTKITVKDAATNKTYKRFIADWKNFYTFELKQGNRVLAKMEFSPYLQPQVSSTGKWDDGKLFNAAIITANTMQIHIMDQTTSDWTYYTFTRDMDSYDDEPADWKDKVFGFGILGITVLGAIGVTKCIEKCIKNKNYKEALKILEEEKKGKKKD
jgi:hypothetical protein